MPRIGPDRVVCSQPETSKIMCKIRHLQSVVADRLDFAKKYAEEWRGMTYAEVNGEPKLELNGDEFHFDEVTKHFRPNDQQVVVRGLHESTDIGLIFIPFVFRGGQVTPVKRQAKRTVDEAANRLAENIDSALDDVADLPSRKSVTGYRRGSNVEIVVEFEDGGTLSATARLGKRPKPNSLGPASEKVIAGLMHEAEELGYLGS